MNKKIIILLAMATILCLGLLCGCQCEHDWADASCTTPKTCTLCKATEGEALGHNWLDASCESPKKCETCGKTKGKALEHTWIYATCNDPQTCEICGDTDGKALGHNWAEATCNDPQTCEICGTTEGEALGHSKGAWEISQDATITEAGIQTQSCDRCGSVLDTKEFQLSSFVNGDVFLFTPMEFSRRLDSTLDDITYDMSADLKSTSEGNMGCLIYYNEELVATIVFSDSENSLKSDDRNSATITTMLAGIDISGDGGAYAMVGIIMACDPTQDFDSAKELAVELLEDTQADSSRVGSVECNGITYVFTLGTSDDSLFGVSVT